MASKVMHKVVALQPTYASTCSPVDGTHTMCLCTSEQIPLN